MFVSKIHKILKTAEKIKTDVDRLILVLTIKKKIPINFAKIGLFSISKL